MERLRRKGDKYRVLKEWGINSVEATGEKEAKMKGAECIAKFIEDKKQEVGRQIDELSDIEEDMSDMVAWLRSKVEELRKT